MTVYIERDELLEKIYTYCEACPYTHPCKRECVINEIIDDIYDMNEVEG